MLGGVQKLPPQAIFALMGYMACSSLLLLTNKLAIHALPATSFILFGQMAFCAFVVFVLGQVGGSYATGPQGINAQKGLIVVDSLEWGKVKGFAIAVLSFVVLIYSNAQTLKYVNVETFIVFRASTPCIMCVADYFFLGRELPNLKSTISIVVLLLGAVLYVSTDAGFHVSGYSWLACWYVIFLFDQLYLKHVANTVKMDSNWGRVFYQNFLSSFPLMAIFATSGDYNVLQNEVEYNFHTLKYFALSVVLGTAMSYFAWLARSLVSATYFSVVGNVCKLITILLNFMVWDKHANGTGIFCLLCCLGAAYFYEQAPLRSMVDKKRRDVNV